ncbi:hypothetical protein ERJ75_000628000 [Trypanosoma vivax]|nr:hypothetical protein ERJ75_000628000 [Trypanosoma vivax]
MCAGMLTMTAMSRVGKVAVRARSRAAEARCEDVLAGERRSGGKLAQSARRVSWCATAIGAQKTKEKNSRAREEMRGRTESHDPGSKRTCERNEVWWHCTGSDCPGQEDSLGRKDKGACLLPPQNATLGPTKVRERRARPCRFCRCCQRKGRGVRARRRGERCRRLELLR